jgi:hypothetical protein
MSNHDQPYHLRIERCRAVAADGLLEWLGQHDYGRPLSAASIAPPAPNGL